MFPSATRANMQATVDDLKRAFHKAKPQYYPSRQRFTFPLKAGEKKPTALVAGKKLSDFNVIDGTVLIFKDLGPQVLTPSLQVHVESSCLTRQLACPCMQTLALMVPRLKASKPRPAFSYHVMSILLDTCRLGTPRCSSGSTLGLCWSMLSSTSSHSLCTPHISVPISHACRDLLH